MKNPTNSIPLRVSSIEKVKAWTNDNSGQPQMSKTLQDIINDKIPLEWLNLTLGTLKMKCKQAFLSV